LSSNGIHPVQNMSAMVELFYHHMTAPRKYLFLATAACQISCQSDTDMGRNSYVNFLRNWRYVTSQAQKSGVLVNVAAANVIIHD